MTRKTLWINGVDQPCAACGVAPKAEHKSTCSGGNHLAAAALVLTSAQRKVLAELRRRGADWTADATRNAWERGESYCLDARNGARKGLARAFEQGNCHARASAAAGAQS